MTDSIDPVRDFARKWYAPWPEQQVLDLFVPVGQRAVCQAWVGLQYEWYECLFALEHDAVRESKLAWWSQELQAMAGGKARHPLTQALQAQTADYQAVAEAISQLAAHLPLRADSTEALFTQLRPLAEALCQCEAVLFQGRQDASSASSLVCQWLLMRLPQGLQAFDRAMLPMHLRARHAGQGEAVLLQAWLQELDACLPLAAANNWFRHAQQRFCRRRIVYLRKGKPPGIGFAHVWDAWRARRG